VDTSVARMQNGQSEMVIELEMMPWASHRSHCCAKIEVVLIQTKVMSWLSPNLDWVMLL